MPVPPYQFRSLGHNHWEVTFGGITLGKIQKLKMWNEDRTRKIAYFIPVVRGRPQHCESREAAADVLKDAYANNRAEKRETA